MLLENRFGVPLPADEVWELLLDIERIAMCIPGASLESTVGDEFAGRVKVKVGPVAVSFKGTAKFEEQDAVARRAVVQATGKEVGGNGSAKAMLTMVVRDDGATSEVEVSTDLAITGKVAKFGRGVIADLAGRLVDEFSHNLLAQLGDPEQQQSPDAATAATGLGTAAAGPQSVAGAPAFQVVTWPPTIVRLSKWTALLVAIVVAVHQSRRLCRRSAGPATPSSGNQCQGSR